MPTITLTGVVKDFSPTVRAVEDLDLTVPSGEFMCLLGPSGCGKTTTMRMIAGLEQPTSGEIAVDGRLLTSVQRGQYVPPEKRAMGLVFQNYALWPHLTVAENTEFGLKMKRWNRQRRAERVKEILQLLQIDKERDRYPTQLSGGQQQRVALARMLATSPDVLLLDEPLSNLDARLRLEMRSELKRIHEESRTTIVFVTHDQLEAMTMATQIAVMNAGRLQQVDTPMGIYGKPANLFVAEFVGSPAMNVLRTDDGHASALGQELRQYVKTFLGADGGIPPVGAVGIRPESLRVATSRDAVAADAWSHAATIETVLPTGSTWILRMKLVDETVFAVTFTEPDVGSHSEAVCWVQPQHLHIFGSEGQRLTEFDEALDGVRDVVTKGGV